MSTGLSALTANQQALKATSTNVANVNTVGYSRLDVQFLSRQASGGLSGIEIEVTRVANAYLAAAEMRGSADVASADILSQFMDRAHAQLEAIHAELPELTLTVREDRLFFGRDAVHVNNDRQEGIPFILYRNAFRRITFVHGMGKEELLEFLASLSIDFGNWPVRL